MTTVYVTFEPLISRPVTLISREISVNWREVAVNDHV